MVDATTPGRQPVTIIEIDQDFCSQSYGVAPCTAAIGTTGSFKCYNTLGTCQDSANYTASTLTLRFCTQTSGFPRAGEAEQYLPIVESVSSVPTELNIANGNSNLQPLGRRASVTIVMRDIPYNDAFVDNYKADRGFNPLTRSTFWAKWLSRNLYYQNRPLRVRDGYIGETVASMRTRNYIIDKITGPDSNGRVTIVAKDILKLAEDKGAQAPRASEGVLLADITAGASSATLTPSGIGASDYPASGKVAIGEEIMSFTRSSDVLTLTRGQNNTTAAAHSAGDTVQLCLSYTDERVDSVIEDLLTTYGNIDASYIDTAAWDAEADEWLVGFNVNTVISEPTGVTKLVSELLEQCSCYIWWDDVNQEINFKAVRPVDKSTIVDITEDNNIIAESLKTERIPDQRVSQVWTYYRRINPTESLTDAANFSGLAVSADLDAEGVNQYGIPSIRTIYSRWFTAANDAQTVTLGSRILTSYRDVPTYITFDLDAKDRTLEVADVIRIDHRSVVDSQGDNLQVLLQVVSREEVESGHKIRYKCQKFGFIGNFANVMENSANDFPSATQVEIDTGGYICNDNGLMDDGSQGYKIS